MIILCIFILSFSKVEADQDYESYEDHLNKMLSVFSALVSGLMTFINSVDMFHNLTLGFTSMQMNIDGNFIYALGLLPFFAYEQLKFGTFSASHIAWAFVNVVSVTFGMISMGNAIEFGKAGPADAIVNIKTIW
jgi:hypothetical protein